MKFPAIAAFCFFATMSFGCGAAEEQDEDFDNLSEALSDQAKGKDDGGKHGGLVALLVCKPAACEKGQDSYKEIVAAVKKAIPALSADPKECVKQLTTAKDQLKDLKTMVGSDLKAYLGACKAEIKAAHKKIKDSRPK